jgi:hypothetical protein
LNRLYTSLPVFITFSEIAWIIALTIAIAYTVDSGNATGQLQKHKEEYNKVKNERDALNEQALKDVLSNKNLSDKNDKLTKENLTLQRELQEIQNKLEQNLMELQNLEQEQEKIRAISEIERGIRKEILGLKGNFKRVAILFDTSYSMNVPERWSVARDVVETWTRYLHLEECVLITFSDRPSAFPFEEGRMLNLSNEQGENNRQKLLEVLRNVQPMGLTDTLGALQMAYQYDGLDTIILFTDGLPTVGGDFNELTQKIYDLCGLHPNVPINVIGLGDYFDKELSTFLIRLADKTGGRFIGR